MTEKGYIKFNCEWKQTAPLPKLEVEELAHWRNQLYDLGLVGAYKDGVGFGNVSIRLGNSLEFIITGSATGHIPQITEEHCTLVKEYSFEKNWLHCEGPIKASSESLTHAAIYQVAPNVKAVVHVHNLDLWNSLLDKVPTTSPNVEYGTPDMAREMIRLLGETRTLKMGILVMAGHKEGVISFGKNLDEAGDIIKRYFAESKAQK